MEGIELPNQKRIRMFGKKETYKYLGISEADTIKQVDMIERFLKSISDEQENFSKSRSTVGILSKK